MKDVQKEVKRRIQTKRCRRNFRHLVRFRRSKIIFERCCSIGHRAAQSQKALSVVCTLSQTILA